MSQRHRFAELVPVSAVKGDNLGELLKLIPRYLPASPALFPEDMISDRSQGFQAAEIVREKLTLNLRQELPYGLTVQIEQFTHDDAGITIHAVIWVERDSQKGIVVGKGGSMLKRVGKAARLELRERLALPVHLELWGSCERELGRQREGSARPGLRRTRRAGQLTGSKRILNTPAWLLHHRPFRDSSQLLDIISRDNGRLMLVARGSRSAKSRLRGSSGRSCRCRCRGPFVPTLGRSTGAEMDGALIALSGDALLAGYYVNELLLNLLHRHDPQPEIFAAYARAIDGFARRSDLSACLREFEMVLLRNLGYALILDHEAQSLSPLRSEAIYEYRADQGPVPVSCNEGPGTYSGEMLLAIGRQDFTQPEVLQGASRLMRDVIAYHLDGKELKTRKVLLELRRMARIPDNPIDKVGNRNLL